MAILCCHSIYIHHKYRLHIPHHHSQSNFVLTLLLIFNLGNTHPNGLPQHNIGINSSAKSQNTCQHLIRLVCRDLLPHYF